MSGDLRRALVLLVTLAVIVPIVGIRSCARKALADEVPVVEDYATKGQVDGLRSDVQGLSGSIQSLNGSVSSQITGVVEGYSTTGQQVSEVRQQQEQMGVTLNEVKDGVSTVADTLGGFESQFDAQGKRIDEVGSETSETLEIVRGLAEQTEDDDSTEEVQQVDLETLLTLLPEGSSDEIVAYMQYPFLWGMAAGIVGWVISLIVGAVYRLLGFR